MSWCWIGDVSPRGEVEMSKMVFTNDCTPGNLVVFDN
jgi:hypothetical protein